MEEEIAVLKEVEAKTKMSKGVAVSCSYCGHFVPLKELENHIQQLCPMVKVLYISKAIVYYLQRKTESNVRANYLSKEYCKSIEERYDVSGDAQRALESICETWITKFLEEMIKTKPWNAKVRRLLTCVV
jgi:hypothetical protein